MYLHQLTSYLEEIAPLALQENYDNAGLILGNKEAIISKALLTLDVTEEVLQEAIQEKADIIISHHPILFSGIKKITGNTSEEKIVIQAIKKDIAIYAIHTNFDNVLEGVNKKIADIIGVTNNRILVPKPNQYKKLVVFCPLEAVEKVRQTLFEAGAGHIGAYDQCSYNSLGMGTFRGLENSTPYVGKKGVMHQEQETKIETIVPTYLLPKVIKAMVAVHPYQEVAYDILPLENTFSQIGSGLIGELDSPILASKLLAQLQTSFGVPTIRYAGNPNKKISRIALCGGSGSFLIPQAIRQKADIFITGDIKYHDFFLANNDFILADIGHYESEQYTKDYLYELINKKFPKFAVQIAKANTNPINYLNK